MKKSAFYLSILALILSIGPGFDVGAQEKAYHVFTSKNGQAIEAAPMLVTPDKTKLGIRRKDGSVFGGQLSWDEISQMPPGDSTGEPLGMRRSNNN